MKQNNSFIVWFSFNILLPLTPIFIKLSITIFGDEQKILVDVLDSTELLYYNFFLCVILLYQIVCKDHKSILEYWMILGSWIIIILDIVLLMLTYGHQDAPARIKTASIIISTLVPIIAAVYRCVYTRGDEV